jgi:hypothetical protein
MQGLLSESTLQLFISCTPKIEKPRQESCRTSIEVSCTLDITVHGPLHLFQELGTWFEEYAVYLQDPTVCHMDVRYCNPHRLSSEDLGSCPMVREVVSTVSGIIQEIAKEPDVLDILSRNCELEEAPQPVAIRATLQRYL